MGTQPINRDLKREWPSAGFSGSRRASATRSVYCYCRAEEVYYTSSQPIPTGGTATGVQFYGRPDVWTEEWADAIYKSAQNVQAVSSGFRRSPCQKGEIGLLPLDKAIRLGSEKITI